jgi:hypothetical protein
MNTELAPAAVAPEGAAPGETTPSARSALRSLCARLLYWSPVFGALALFAQVSFLGLRPALCEARRLADADVMLQARYDRDRGLYEAYELQVRVRRDPVFLERQRRMRRAQTAPIPSPGAAAPENAPRTDRAEGA